MKGRELWGERGFTLVELLVVMSILAVLAAMVFPTLTGLKTTGETAAGKGDAKEVENAINAFNTNSRAQTFPESPIACDFTSGSQPVTLTINTKSVSASSSTSTDANAVLKSALVSALGMSLCTADGDLTTHTQVNWEATADVRQSDGTLKTLKFIPDFLLSKPKSATWVRGSSSSAADEFLWLLLKGTASDGLAGRTLQVLRLTADGTAYEAVRY